MRFRRGLTLGKFAPFHKGHQLLVETALEECDELILVIYDAPELTNIPLIVRSNWIKTIYPQITVIEAWDGPTEVGNSPRIQRLHEEYLIEDLHLKDIDAFYSSEFYGEHISLAFGAYNRLVDPDREACPISGSAIRKDAYSYRGFLAPLVYRDLITNIVFLGAPCTGKTTIAQRLSLEFNTQWMHEFGREFWEEFQVDRKLSPKQLAEIAEGHIFREDQLLLESNTYLFTDTNALTTRIFSLYYHGSALPRLDELANSAQARYDIVFLCEADIPYDNTWDRSGEANREMFQKMIRADLQLRRIPYILLEGPIEQRVEKVKGVLQSYRKFSNLFDQYI